MNEDCFDKTGVLTNNPARVAALLLVNWRASVCRALSAKASRAAAVRLSLSEPAAANAAETKSRSSSATGLAARQTPTNSWVAAPTPKRNLARQLLPPHPGWTLPCATSLADKLRIRSACSRGRTPSTTNKSTDKHLRNSLHVCCLAVAKQTTTSTRTTQHVNQ